ncbi:MAG TPA: serine/threonine protein kinase, partial [Rectinemataceae bacterium]
PYSSYVNRVYGFTAEDGASYVVKFYRPGRWSAEAIRQEHAFLSECNARDIPVVPPLAAEDGQTLFVLEAESETGIQEYHFAIFPKRGGRSFDAESDSDWIRLGALAGRLHSIGALARADARPRLSSALALNNLEVIEPLVHPEFRAKLSSLCRQAIARSAFLIDDLPILRIHGDLHRGNILDRQGEGLLLLDFDDMVMGPAVQDLWLLLPGRTHECRRELSLLLEGYSEFSALPPGSLAAIETLRLFRILHFLAWRSIQREDDWFRRDFPDWGGRAFWLAEFEDIADQVAAIENGLD